MKTLSIRQPWSWLILHQGKNIENRTWYTPYRGPLFIHAGKLWDENIQSGKASIDPEMFDLVMERYGITIEIVKQWIRESGKRTFGEVFLTGGIVGKVDLVDCVQNHPSIWAIKGQWHWVLEHPEPLPFMACKGQLGLFEVKYYGQ
jgi:hypothetical protein